MPEPESPAGSLESVGESQSSPRKLPSAQSDLAGLVAGDGSRRRRSSADAVVGAAHVLRSKERLKRGIRPNVEKGESALRFDPTQTSLQSLRSPSGELRRLGQSPSGDLRRLGETEAGGGAVNSQQPLHGRGQRDGRADDGAAEGGGAAALLPPSSFLLSAACNAAVESEERAAAAAREW